MGAPFQIAVHRPPARVPLAIIEVRGEVDAVTSSRLQEAAAEACRQGACHLLLDLSDVSFMGSACLRVLITIDEMLRSQSGQTDGDDDQAAATPSFKSPNLKILSPSPTVARTLKISGFEMIFDIFSDRQTALDVFA